MHTSIWQYFVAERIYEILVKCEKERDINNFLDDLSEIFVLNKTLDETVFILSKLHPIKLYPFISIIGDI